MSANKAAEPSAPPPAAHAPEGSPIWFTVKQAAQYISVSPGFIRKLVTNGMLVAANVSIGRVHREWRIQRIHLDAFMASRNSNEVR